MKKFDISSFGELLIDFTSVKNELSNKKIFEQNPGGAPGNVLVCASRLGCKTSFIGKVGNDMHGKFLKDTLENNNVDTTNLVLDDKYFTTLAFVDISESGERSFSFSRKPGADIMFDVSDLNKEIIKDSKIFHVGSLSLTNLPSRETTYEAIEFAKQNNIIVSYDPNYRESLWNSKSDAVYYMRSIVPNIIKMSLEEIELLTNHKDIHKASSYMINKGVSIVVITLGSKGCIITTKEGFVEVPSIKTNVVDTTGAGDAFFGSFLMNISKSNKSIEDIKLSELKEFGYFSNVVASICIKNTGGIPSMPTLDEVNSKIKSYRN